MTITTTPAKKRLTSDAMIASIADGNQRVRKAPLGHALLEAAQQNPKIVGLSAISPSTPTCTSSGTRCPIASTRWAWPNRS